MAFILWLVSNFNRLSGNVTGRIFYEQLFRPCGEDDIEREVEQRLLARLLVQPFFNEKRMICLAV